MNHFIYKLAGALFFCALLLIPFPVGPDRFFWREFFDAGHVILFFLLTIILFKTLPYKEQNSFRKIAIAGLTSFSISVFLEALQPLFERSWSLEDLALGTLGIISACVFLSNAFIGMALFLIAQTYGAFPAIQAAKAIRWRANSFPVIAEFETEGEMNLWSGSLTRDEQNNYLKVSGQSYSLATYSAGHQDWSNYKALHFKVYNPKQNTASISIRIDDDGDCESFEQRFSKSYQINSGWNEISIPLNLIVETPSEKELNTSKISKIYFFSYGETSMKSFYLDSIFLQD